MRLGPYQLQIGSVLLILGAAVLALFCDFLRRRNEQHKEELKRSQAKPAPILQKTAAVAVAAPKKHPTVVKTPALTALYVDESAGADKRAATTGSGLGF